MDTRLIVQKEIALINRMLQAHNIQARTKPRLVMVVKSSFIAYGLQIAHGQTTRQIDAIGRELSNELTRQRVRLLPGYRGRAMVRLRDFPLAIEVPHPAPVALSWQAACLRAGPHVALIGRSYDYSGARGEWLDLDRHYHTLVAAMSGGGKSTLMKMALLTLTLNTSPADLRVMLIDLKNDDLTPFRTLPHVMSYAGDIETAVNAIAQTNAVKTERIETQAKPYRLLLVIDELAELGQAKDALRMLGSVLSTGRSLGINVWAGTQYPTAATIGNVVNASFTTRLVGMVDGMQAAATATKRAGSGAHLLQTPGDFLRVEGMEMRRMKGYSIDDDDTVRLIDRISRRWRTGYQAATSPAIASYEADTGTATSGENVVRSVAGYDSRFPIRAGRALTATEAQAVRRMAEAGEFDYRDGLSLNRAMQTVYGSRSPERAEWIRQALESAEIGA